MKTIIFIVTALIAFWFIHVADQNRNQAMKYKRERDSLQYITDSTIYFYEDISNCIRKDFGIDTSKKVMFHQIKLPCSK